MDSNNSLLPKFAEFIAEKWNGNFQHRFSIPKHHRAWQTWKTKFSHLNCAETIWECSNLREAYERYSWPESDESIEDIRALLKQSIASRNENLVQSNCLKIFRWGGVAKNVNDPSLQWILRNEGQLSTQIIFALSLLNSQDADLACFDGKNLLMNSAMTKVYWAADEHNKLAIYDGRVGAALGLLSRNFLQEKGSNKVPDELAFSWGSSREKHVQGIRDKRNPSDTQLKYPRLFNAKNKDFHHAKMMRDASNLFQLTSKLLEDKVSVNHLERAMFMIGYDVTQNEMLSS